MPVAYNSLAARCPAVERSASHLPCRQRLLFIAEGPTWPPSGCYVLAEDAAA
jgi:hypothetical protein